MPVPVEIESLVDKFHKNITFYKNPRYKEAQVRVEFIDRFFKSLGWDVNHEKSTSPEVREVIVEDSLTIEDEKDTYETLAKKSA